MLIGDVTVWSGDRMIAGLSGDNDVPAEHAKRISLDASAKGCRVVWHCRNGDPRDVRTYVDGQLVQTAGGRP
jgi:hypothetical protein